MYVIESADPRRTLHCAAAQGSIRALSLTGLHTLASDSEDEVARDDCLSAWGIRMLVAGASMYAEYSSGDPTYLADRVEATIALILDSQRRPPASGALTIDRGASPGPIGPRKRNR